MDREAAAALQRGNGGLAYLLSEARGLGRGRRSRVADPRGRTRRRYSREGYAGGPSSARWHARNEAVRLALEPRGRSDPLREIPTTPSATRSRKRAGR